VGKPADFEEDFWMLASAPKDMGEEGSGEHCPIIEGQVSELLWMLLLYRKSYL
jgi:hypothetical protein